MSMATPETELGKIFNQTADLIGTQVDRQRSAVEEREAREQLAVPKFVELLHDLSCELMMYDVGASYSHGIDTLEGANPAQVSLKRNRVTVARFTVELHWETDDDLLLKLTAVEVEDKGEVPDINLGTPIIWQVHRLGITPRLSADQPHWANVRRKLAVLAATLACRERYGAAAVAAARKALVPQP